MSHRSTTPTRTAASAQSGWRHCLLALLICCVAGSMLWPQTGQAASWRDEFPAAVKLGAGELRWFGLRIYHATLWAEQTPFQLQRPFALQLRYHRNISRERLVETSIAEIQRLHPTLADQSTLQRWRDTLLRAFTDVSTGDELIGVYQPAQGMRLYNQQQLLAEVKDPALALAFFSIWLDERSHDQGLRKQLLGTAP